MAFWAQASAAQGSRPNQSGPARPLTYILSAGANSLTDFTTLVRLRVDVASAAASLAAAAQDAEDEETAAQQAEDAACAVGQLHQVVVGIEQASDEARSSSLLELMGDKTLQLLCSKVLTHARHHLSSINQKHQQQRTACSCCQQHSFMHTMNAAVYCCMCRTT